MIRFPKVPHSPASLHSVAAAIQHQSPKMLQILSWNFLLFFFHRRLVLHSDYWQSITQRAREEKNIKLNENFLLFRRVCAEWVLLVSKQSRSSSTFALKESVRMKKLFKVLNFNRQKRKNTENFLLVLLQTSTFSRPNFIMCRWGTTTTFSGVTRNKKFI